ncbi:MAG: hypothetical protein COX48_02735 [bacterium (Candidatus Stahlbacteria) CG23_combo_of_CG06-09_8_20_14_all_34_7]|nr:MAG: hypothetical protein COX48_02735 [bacterium (Candidatus Stahlbacteria) CG23_combo_of_CG06-09_8_20_14_all_34_7]
MTGYFFLLITIILFSSMETAGRMIHSSIGPLTMTFIRFLIGFFLILLFILLNNKERNILRGIKINDILNIFLLGFINVFLSMMFLQIAVHKGNASIPAILISCNPLFVYIITSLSEKHLLKSHIIKIISGILGITGIIIFHSSKSFENPGVAFSLSLCSSILFAFYIVRAHKLVSDFSNLIVTGLSFLFGTLCYLPFIFIFEDFSVLASLRFKEVVVLLYMGLFVTGIGYVFFFEGLKRVKVHIGSLVFFLKPMFALLFSFILLKERISSIQILFIFLILYSIKPDITKKNVDNTCK